MVTEKNLNSFIVFQHFLIIECVIFMYAVYNYNQILIFTVSPNLKSNLKVDN